MGGSSSFLRMPDFTFSISVASLRTSGIDSNPTGNELFSFSNALPSQSGHGAYFQHGQFFYELICTHNFCNWNLLQSQLINPVVGGIMIYSPRIFEGIRDCIDTEKP